MKYKIFNATVTLIANLPQHILLKCCKGVDQGVLYSSWRLGVATNIVAELWTLRLCLVRGDIEKIEKKWE